MWTTVFSLSITIPAECSSASCKLNNQSSLILQGLFAEKKFTCFVSKLQKKRFNENENVNNQRESYTKVGLKQKRPGFYLS